MSARMNLDFTSSPALYLFSGWLSWLSLFFGLLASIYIWQLHQSQQDALLQIHTKLSQINVKPVKRNLPENIVQVAIPPEKKLQIQDTVTALTLPWNALLGAIEKPDMHDVALLSFTPNAKNQQVILEAEAKNLPAALHYVEALQMQAVFDRVYLQKHSVDEANVSKPVKFNVFAHWQITE